MQGDLFSSERANKLLLILLAVLLAFVFMDMQARRKKKTPELSADSYNMRAESASSVAGVRVRPVPVSNVSSAKIVQHGLLFKSVADPAPRVALYYLRFKPGQVKTYETELVRVERDLPVESPRSIKALLELLQKGPQSQERGLISAFDEKSKIQNVRVEDRCAVLEVDESFGRLGNHVIRDRLDQVIYTLTELESIDCVRLEEKGQGLRRIGAYSMEIAARLERRSRAVVPYLP